MKATTDPKPTSSPEVKDPINNYFRHECLNDLCTGTDAASRAAALCGHSMESTSVVGPKTYIGIDNGFTGAMGLVNHQNQITCAPVPVIDLGKRKYLDRTRTIAQLKTLTQGDALQNVVAVYEHSPITPRFGAINNFVNGQNNEFWRMLLGELGISFLWVHPRTWQKHIFRGIRGTDTKTMARFVCGQRFPHFQPDGYRPNELLGIYDALCIALWGRDTHQ